MPTSAARAGRSVSTPPEAVSAPLKAHPIVKWAGGKGRLLAQLEPLLPPAVEQRRHVEPFLGGGAMFFSRRPERALLSDVNPALIRTYRAVQRDVSGVIAALRRLAARHDKDHFYETRDRYNRLTLGPAEHAATFIYLNKTCFNGLHRVNRRGEFNVPYGRYEKPRILDEAVLRAASRAFAAAELEIAGFEALIERARPGDFIYFDPPYAPVSSTANFTSYAQNGFAHEDQARLADVYRALDRRGCRLMLSNSDVPAIHELYAAFRIDLVAAPRAISCNAAKRKAVTEVVVRNY